MLINKIRKFCHGIDVINEWVGNSAAWLVVPLALLVTTEVVLRYVFNRPTIWIWDVNVQILGVGIILGGGYALLQNAHVGVDVLVGHLSPTKRRMVELITYMLFLFAISIILYEIALDAWSSIKLKERMNTFFMPPIYPFKIITVVGMLLIFLQGLNKFLTVLMDLIPQKSEA